MMDDYRDLRPDCAQKGNGFCEENCKYAATCSAVVMLGYCWAHMDCATCEYTKDCAAFHHRGENWEDFGRIERCEAENDELEILRTIVESLMAARGLLSCTAEPTRRDNYIADMHMTDALGRAKRLIRDIEIRRKAPAGRKPDLSGHNFIIELMLILDEAYELMKGNVFGSTKKARALVREALNNLRNLSAYSIRGDKNDIIFLAPEGIGRKKLEELLSGTGEKGLEEKVRELERLMGVLKEKLEACMSKTRSRDNNGARETFRKKFAMFRHARRTRRAYLKKKLEND